MLEGDGNEIIPVTIQILKIGQKHIFGGKCK